MKENSYSNEVEDLKKYREELDELYSSEKDRLDEISKNANKMRGALTFITNQVNNLVSIKNASINITKNIVDFKSKEFNEGLKSDQSNNEDNLSASIHTLINDIIDKNKQQFIMDPIDENDVTKYLLVNEKYEPICMVNKNDDDSLIYLDDKLDIGNIIVNKDLNIGIVENEQYGLIINDENKEW